MEHRTSEFTWQKKKKKSSSQENGIVCIYWKPQTNWFNLFWQDPQLSNCVNQKCLNMFSYTIWRCFLLKSLILFFIVNKDAGNSTYMLQQYNLSLWRSFCVHNFFAGKQDNLPGISWIMLIQLRIAIVIDWNIIFTTQNEVICIYLYASICVSAI